MDILKILLLALLILTIILLFIKIDPFYIDTFKVVDNVSYIKEPDPTAFNNIKLIKNYSVLYLPQNFTIKNYLSQKRVEIKKDMTIDNYYNYSFEFNTNFVFYYTPKLQTSISLLFPKLKFNDLVNFFIYYSILFYDFKSYFYMLDLINLVILDNSKVQEISNNYNLLISYYNILIESFYDFTSKNKIRKNNILELLNTSFNKTYTQEEYKEFEEHIKKESSVIIKNKKHISFFITIYKTILTMNSIKIKLPKIDMWKIDLSNSLLFMDNHGLKFIKSLNSLYPRRNDFINIFENNSFIKDKMFLYALETFYPEESSYQEAKNQTIIKINTHKEFLKSDKIGSLKNPLKPEIMNRL